MTRARRRNEPTDPWLIVTAVLAVVLLFLIVVAVIWLLGSGGEETASPTPSASASAPAASASPSAGASTEPSGGAASPSPGASSAPSSAPSAAPSPSPSAGASPGASASASPGASPDASACSGSEENQAFFAAAADKLSFDVYCAVLPSGWSLVSGSYRSASGGRLEISYKGPGGATLRLRQGPAACADDPACPPGGFEVGDAMFGDLAGTLIDTDAGYAVVVSDASVPYYAETTGLEAEAAQRLTDALARIGMAVAPPA